MTTKRRYLKVTYFLSDENQLEVFEPTSYCNDNQRKYLKVTYNSSDDNKQEIIESNLLL